MSNRSPYISSASSTNESPMPSRIGWSGWRFHRRSRSLASRHSRLHEVPISRRKMPEKWPEWSTTMPMPLSTRWWTRSTMAALT